MEDGREDLMIERPEESSTSIGSSRKAMALECRSLFEGTDNELRRLIEKTIARHKVYGHDAEDIAQEVCSKLLKAVRSPKTEEIRHLAAWIHQITVYAVIDFKRRRRRRPVVLDLNDQVDPSSRDRKAREREDAFREAMESLPDLLREVVELHYFDGRTLADTAAKLNVCVNTVRDWRDRALAILRDKLREFSAEL